MSCNFDPVCFIATEYRHYGPLMFMATRFLAAGRHVFLWCARLDVVGAAFQCSKDA